MYRAVNGNNKTLCRGDKNGTFRNNVAGVLDRYSKSAGDSVHTYLKNQYWGTDILM